MAGSSQFLPLLLVVNSCLFFKASLTDLSSLCTISMSSAKCFTTSNGKSLESRSIIQDARLVDWWRP